nr:MAG TPA: hypothetical protein [Caudoviricetes sp.]
MRYYLICIIYFSCIRICFSRFYSIILKCPSFTLKSNRFNPRTTIEFYSFISILSIY